MRDAKFKSIVATLFFLMPVALLLSPPREKRIPQLFSAKKQQEPSSSLGNDQLREAVSENTRVIEKATKELVKAREDTEKRADNVFVLGLISLGFLLLFRFTEWFAEKEKSYFFAFKSVIEVFMNLAVLIVNRVG